MCILLLKNQFFFFAKKSLLNVFLYLFCIYFATFISCLIIGKFYKTSTHTWGLTY